MIPRSVSRQGFSLIEMLVVLFVVVMLTSLATLTMNSGGVDRRAQDKMEALAAVASYALDEAQVSGSDFGVLFAQVINEDGDTVVAALWRQRLPAGWRPPEVNDTLYDPIEFPADTEFDFFLDGVEVLLADDQATDPLNGRTPQWLLLASGETQPGELSLRDGQSGATLWRLTWDALARFDSRGPGDGEEDEFRDLAFGG